MKRVKQMNISAKRKPAGRDGRAVPLMVPHGGIDAGRDFESALEVLQSSGKTRALWRRARVRIPFGRTP